VWRRHFSLPLGGDVPGGDANGGEDGNGNDDDDPDSLGSGGSKARKGVGCGGEGVWRSLCVHTWKISEAMVREWPRALSWQRLQRWAPMEGFYVLQNAFPWGIKFLMRFEDGAFACDAVWKDPRADGGTDVKTEGRVDSTPSTKRKRHPEFREKEMECHRVFTRRHAMGENENLREGRYKSQ